MGYMFPVDISMLLPSLEIIISPLISVLYVLALYSLNLKRTSLDG